ncbi:MAG: TetR/AcrR family transcriptional regulator [Acidimicrobiia bacterium]|nr:TetR/AcrR family transcriptional regulator [Acidimicrobiia bacterium]
MRAETRETRGEGASEQKTGARRLGEPTVTAADWVQAALQLIAESGLSALTVDRLASRLGVTKGSFYWHFEGRSDLLARALAQWESGATTDTTKTLSSVTDPHRRLELMLDAASQAPRARSLYAALAEAAHDPTARQVLNRVAAFRIGYLESCYRDVGLTPVQAKARALFAYAAYRGLIQLAHEAPSVLPTDWSAYPVVARDALLPPRFERRAARSRRRARRRPS